MSSSKNLVPEAKADLDQFKMEAAGEVGVNLSKGYNGDLTSRQADSVGGQMVDINEEKQLVSKYEGTCYFAKAREKVVSVGTSKEEFFRLMPPDAGKSVIRFLSVYRVTVFPERKNMIEPVAGSQTGAAKILRAGIHRKGNAVITFCHKF